MKILFTVFFFFYFGSYQKISTHMKDFIALSFQARFMIELRSLKQCCRLTNVERFILKNTQDIKIYGT
jgi:hypothetical protein